MSSILLADDDSDFYDEGLNYEYVEDGDALADDLAANAVPDAPEFDGDNYWDDQSRYEFWNDIEYDTDGYNDVMSKKILPRRKKTRQTTERHKKRRALRSVTTQPISVDSELPPVLLLDKRTIEHKRTPEPVPDPKTLASISVLADWRERFPNAIDTSSGSSNISHTDAFQVRSLDQDEETDPEITSQDIPKEALERALKEHFQRLGIDTRSINQDLLLQFAQQMLSGGNDGEDDGGGVLDELMEAIHPEDEQKDEQDAFASWISGQIKSTPKKESSSRSKRKRDSSSSESPNKKSAKRSDRVIT